MERTLDKFAEIVQERLQGKKGQDVEAFGKHLISCAPREDIEALKPSDLYGLVLDTWQFIQDFEDDLFKIRVFNPDYEQNAWQSTHTIIQVLGQNMPFMIDSMRMELNRRHITIHSIHYSLIATKRDNKNLLTSWNRPENDKIDKEVIIHLEIDRHTAKKQLDELQNALAQILKDVETCVHDYKSMQEKVLAISEEINKPVKGLAKKDQKEACEFLSWLDNNHFTYLGYDEFSFDEKSNSLKRQRGNQFGLLKHYRRDEAEIEFCLGKDLKEVYGSPVLQFLKSGVRSHIHRPAYPDYLIVKRFDEEGNLTGLARILGVYTSEVYTADPSSIPIVRNKVDSICDRFVEHGNMQERNMLLRILAVYPRDELFQSSVKELGEIAVGVLQIRERRKIRLFVRQGRFGMFANCLLYMPRDLYSTELRERIQNILVEEHNATDIEFTTYFSESILARTHFIVRLDSTNRAKPNHQELEQKVIRACSDWEDDLEHALVDQFGEEKGSALSLRFGEAFRAGYKSDFQPRTAVADIEHIHELDEGKPLALSFYRSPEDEDHQLRLRLFKRNSPLPLSDVMPVLEQMGLHVLGEHPYKIHPKDEDIVWLHDFRMRTKEDYELDVPLVRENFEETIFRVWEGELASDTFNELVLKAGLNTFQVNMLRAYASYMKQIRFGFSQTYISSTLANHQCLVQKLVELFEAKFNPELADQEKAECLREEILKELEDVSNLNEDRILRRYIELISATLRTNAYVQDEEGRTRPYLSFKFSPALIPDMPLPRPLFEIFVYSPRVEGVHLRGGRVARGGLRWSDRLEDYRTEVLGLVKAQQVKNSVIVPAGAKGGFIAKRLTPSMSREEFQNEGVACYQQFISGLLDVTDNLVEGNVVPPKDVIRLDEDDTYLVVAADKGTATFSDIANAIAIKYGFWLGDAFASGGSDGYDHKKMGITARGAWVSVQRHFRERGIDVQTDNITVVGIGDMGGDVFGNGMLRSKAIKLVAAFNHMHIFIDPHPDPEKSFVERERMFYMPRSTWEDFDSNLISQGGGVYSRSAKWIKITPEMKEVFGITADRLAPNDMIQHLLKAEVDLLWNGGIGTYVKSSEETNSQVGDRANDSLRINGKDLRAKVIGEGGNLGFTQRGRIEYALNGGACYTDAIDNAGGVDCSDHEVNIKILLQHLMEKGELTLKQRNDMLVDMTAEVADLVLKNNYRQATSISNASQRNFAKINEYMRFISHLEDSGRLNRDLEFLPNNEVLDERRRQEIGLTRPELSVLISYAKNELKDTLSDAEGLDDPYVLKEALREFPVRLRHKYFEEIMSLRLNREIVATQLANEIVNLMGDLFVHRMRNSTGLPDGQIAKAFIVARDVFRLREWWLAIDKLDHQVNSKMQFVCHERLMRLIRRATRWFLRNTNLEQPLEQIVDTYRPVMDSLFDHLDDHLSDTVRDEWMTQKQEFIDSGVPEDLARFVTGTPSLYGALTICDAARDTNTDVDTTAGLFFKLREKLGLHWFIQQVNGLEVTNHWQGLAREALMDDMDWQQKALLIHIMNCQVAEGPESDVKMCLVNWFDESSPMVQRWLTLLNEVRNTENPELAMFTVAMRELSNLAHV
ncbi:NAD-glutamate dehydrogenase [Litoribrevibacter albus]|uniref:NAD-specific glutamate dehydrogenase n=1 Tax=Litoribrevibacter albus TaxID=1473156 RepID=A0AA37S9G9_9GAMM|nr:NAD-glutamate dehydrogenase [Litoribrevibacter albus]GLQ30723.1 NAD-specific glutamate dehydrogenase [Litoribrevibacter albus]